MTDSRQIRRGDTFVAYPGATSDGRDFIPQALGNGAAGVLWESRGFAWNPAWNVPNLGVPDLRRRAGEIASHIYGQPSARLWVVGVTGTNGKTSCSQWIAQSLGRTGRKCAVIGTLGSGFPGALEATGNTTPDAVWLQASLMSFLRCGARAACMEVSSHGLEQHRLSGVKFDVALFTNISRDHLDYHGTMRRYRAAKARLFGWPSLKYAVLNLDDGFGVELASRAGGARVVGYGFARDRIPRRNADRMLSVQGRNLRVHTGGISFDVTTPWGAASLSSRLIGGFNAANLLGSLATLLASDVSLEESIRALQRVKAVPGRTERYGGGSRPLVIIDYAHTPDALEKILIALRELLPASRLEGPSSRVQTKRSLRSNSEPGTRNPELICVFGCGGERDRGKRPLMGSIAAALADHVVITSDNPRSEDPQAIIRDIARGVRGAHATIEPDRSRAIRLAIGMAHRGDVVLVAGKGHERYQEVRGVRYPFSDATAVTAALRAAAG
ncbi:MAG: UDP-N-acetylmuramoyl-L-alanyl-D-glutamate--2,6-diaminopimelate ligase [Betaproteobacteria bacterium]|nr:UDP-N-acetylmuramoyl-L-alanyl-D-glutamate--2,6-diaminopimelate ligase [Betaproteobacteria bacterium]